MAAAATVKVVSPVDGSVVAEVPLATHAEVCGAGLCPRAYAHPRLTRVRVWTGGGGGGTYRLTPRWHGRRRRRRSGARCRSRSAPSTAVASSPRLPPRRPTLPASSPCRWAGTTPPLARTHARTHTHTHRCRPWLSSNLCVGVGGGTPGARPLSQTPGEVNGTQERANYMISIAEDCLKDIEIEPKPGARHRTHTHTHREREKERHTERKREQLMPSRDGAPG
jgi:hypothetical protein